MAKRKRSWEVAAPSSGAALDADAALFEFHTCCPHTKLAVCTCPYFAPQQPPVDLAMAGKLWQWLQDALKERAIRMRLLAEHPGFYRNEQELREDAAYERLRERCFETRPHQFPAFSSASEPTPVAFCPVDPRRPTSGMDDIMAAPTPWATLGLDWSRTKASTRKKRTTAQAVRRYTAVAPISAAPATAAIAAPAATPAATLAALPPAQPLAASRPAALLSALPPAK